MEGSREIVPYEPAPVRDEEERPPSNIEAEQQLLGALLVNNAGYYRVADFLRVEHFHEPAHARIFALIAEQIATGKPAKPVLLARLAMADTDLREAFPEGPAGYIAKLAGACMVTIHPEDYAECIVDCWRERQMMEITDAARGEAMTLGASVAAANVSRRLAEIAGSAPGQSGPRLAAHAMDAALERVREAMLAEGGLIGVTTGLLDLDKLLGGFSPSMLYVIAARPGMGKTSLCKTMALAAARAGRIVPFFSLDMPADQLGMWLLADLTGISADRQRRGQVDNHDVDRLVEARASLDRLQLYIDEEGALTMPAIRARVMRLKAKGELGPIFVDHIGHIRASKESKRQNRVAEMTEITGDLLALAKEMRAPVVALSQLSRAVEGRDDKRPSLSDLRDSGSIEQDADTVIFAYREEYYLERAKPQRKPGQNADKHATAEADWRDDMKRCQGLCDLIVAKNRSGPIDSVRVRFEPERSRMTNFGRGY